MKKYIFFGFFLTLFACQFTENKGSEGLVTGEESIDTSLAIELGEALFFDSMLSLDSSISCSSCHLPQFAFADTARVSKGVHNQVGFRNTPSIFNLREKPFFFMEGGVENLHRATLGPMLTEEEMSLQAPQLLERIASNVELHQNFIRAYGEGYEYRDVVDALVQYQLSLESLDAEWDRYTVSGGDEEWERGRALFNSDSLNCSTCHPAPLFRDDKFHDLGSAHGEPLDYGRGRLTFDSIDYYKFPTPSLRNVALTAPYMHDGSVETLEEVIELYQAGGGPRKPNDLSTSFRLNDQDKQALLRFLESLTGDAAKSAHHRAQSNG